MGANVLNKTGLKRLRGTTFWSLFFKILLEELANLNVRSVSMQDAVHIFWAANILKEALFV